MTSLENMVISVAPEDDTKPVLNLNTDAPPAADIANKPSVNFGGGIELLMNDLLINELFDLYDLLDQKYLLRVRATLSRV